MDLWQERYRCHVIAVCCALVSTVAFGQARFEVTSIKPNKSADARASIGVQAGGRFRAMNVSAKTLISYAYQVQDYQIIGAPGWLSADRFDILASAPQGIPFVPAAAGGPPSTIQLMTRGLLADRFGLAVHTDTRDLPIYSLVSPQGSSRGTSLQRSAADCSRPITLGRGGGAQAPADPNARPTCGMRVAPGSISAGDRSLTDLANTLSQFVQRPVVNRTGLEGLFDFDLRWAYEPAAGAPIAAQVHPVDPDAPNLFTAVREQLGLRLDAARGAVPVLIIDEVSHPAPD